MKDVLTNIPVSISGVVYLFSFIPDGDYFLLRYENTKSKIIEGYYGNNYTLMDAYDVFLCIAKKGFFSVKYFTAENASSFSGKLFFYRSYSFYVKTLGLVDGKYCYLINLPVGFSSRKGLIYSYVPYAHTSEIDIDILRSFAYDGIDSFCEMIRRNNSTIFKK